MLKHNNTISNKIIKLFKTNPYSIKSKIIVKFTRYYFTLSSIILTIIFSTIIMLENENLEYIKSLIIITISSIIIIYLIMKVILSKLITDILLKRLNLLEKDLDNIKNGNLFDKIKIFGIDEIDRIMHDTNIIFDKLNKSIKIEREISLIDPLTKAYNRRALSFNFNNQIEKNKRNGETISLLMFDLDNFKKINDTYGHNTGDKVLVNLVKMVKIVLRKYDSLYRIGGEEFVVLFPNLNSEDKKQLLTRIRKEITYKLKKNITNVLEEITISGGFISTKNLNLNNKNLLDEMLKIADEQLYKAKKSGKNKIIAVE